MGWYLVTKTIKGSRYVYLQRTWREGRHVRTQSVYVGPAGDSARAPNTTYTAYHGSRAGIPQGATPKPSAHGVHGPGFYLALSKRRADLYARYHPKIAADFDRIGGNVGEPHFAGAVEAFDLSELNILFVKDGDTYIDLADAAGTGGDLKGYATPDDKVALQELLVAKGYDGIEVNDPDRMEIVIFPSAVERLKEVNTTDQSDRSPPEASEPNEQPSVPRAKPRGDVYTRITDKIIDALERGVRPWQRPWGSGKPVSRPLRHNDEPYHGANVIMLWLSAEERGFTSPYWMTFRQAQELGGNVRRGQKGTTIAYVSSYTRTEEDDEGEETDREILVRKSYTVFNADQIEGLPDQYHPAPPEPLDPTRRIQHTDRFFEATGADIRHGGDRAFYSPSMDYVQMPPFEQFRDPESHAATLGHELIHWTRHPSRLDRDFGRKRWGDAGYAMEELVAEIGAAFLCTDLGITPEIRDDHAQYVGSWLEVLKNDKRAIFTAAAHAEKAVGLLHEQQGDRSDHG